ncbi:SpoIIE family protein phosphatase [Actinomadura rudentiformis]|uniref:SpoIIE family protein phosphatase n=1 Tax=Actinomadura rudentiformis TaxID=359158 RepID=A0A6H9YB64_9ACTN|nr:SpoIIE family protein phosphatase [Actinomadura rudentiformis]KAB2342125.1 SpoIIE family protein phosphatase [Actinomadura rudentiformis]
MAEQLEPETILREISDLEGRIEELRQAANMPVPDLRATLDAALVELELALTALRTMGVDQANAAGRSATAETERRVLRTVFQDAPVPLFLLDRDAGVRRVNKQAAAMLGTSPGYVSGKQFIAFCDLPARAALRSQLAAVVRTGRRRRTEVRFLGREHPVDAMVTMARVWIRGEPDPMIVVAAGATAVPDGPADDERPTRTATPAAGTAGGAAREAAPLSDDRDDEVMAALVHRMDVLATASELLLDEPVFNENVAVRRCARLLTAEMTEWVFIDLTPPRAGPASAGGTGAPGAAGHEANGDLRRVVVMGQPDEHGEETVHSLEQLAPEPGTLPHTVFTTRQSALRPHVEDLDLLGVCADGQPACVKMGATSVLCVPVEDGDRCIGTITLASRGEHGPLDLLDLGVAQRLGRLLALVIRASRLYQRRDEIAVSLQASLLPQRLPQIPGVEVAGLYRAATHGIEVGGDFYDVFPAAGGGWGMVLGDVCGKGQEAAAVTAAARHGVRALSGWKSDPAEVLSMVNQALLDEERFVTAVMAGLTVGGEGMKATLASAGHPPAIVIRPDGMVRYASSGGVPLGLFEDFEVGTQVIELAAGDTLFLHSDGVLDACDMSRRQFGQERLLEVLAGHAAAPLQEMLNAVEQRLIDYCDGDLRDDVSMLAVRRQPTPLN